MKKVLIVDDAAFIRMQLKQLLIKNNYDVVGEAENGKEALEKIQSLKPDIVTLDITMPVMNGIECLAEINKMEEKPLVVMVTALGQEEYVQKAIMNGAKGFIVKPYKPEEQMVTFLLGKEEYAIDIMQVKEIIRVPQLVKVPNCQTYIDGVVSIRNNLMPMINLRTYFEMERMEANDQMRVLVADMGHFFAGIIVDRVSEVIRVPVSNIQPPPKISAQAGEQLKGVARLNDGKRIILLLDPAKLLSADEISSLENIKEEKDTVMSNEETSAQVLDEEKIVVFKLGTEEYGINIANVQEINRMTNITKIPRAPHHIEGIVNLRGNVIPALDIRKLFNLDEKQITDSTRIIIVDVNNKRTGIIVDSVTEVISLDKRIIEPTPDILSNGVDSDYFEGVAKLGNKRMIMILDLSEILD